MPQLMVIGIIFSLIAAGIGGFLGWLASIPYVAEKEGAVGFIGLMAGGLGGLLAGVFYMRFLWSRLCRQERVRYLWWGMAAGVLCSTMVHVTLMMVFSKVWIIFMLVGDFCGVVAGLLLGAAMYGSLKFVQQKASRMEIAGGGKNE